MTTPDDGGYRVWPDGTVQATEDGEPYSWMSDDFMVIKAENEEEALAMATAPWLGHRCAGEHVPEKVLEALCAPSWHAVMLGPTRKGMSG